MIEAQRLTSLELVVVKTLVHLTSSVSDVATWAKFANVTVWALSSVAKFPVNPVLGYSFAHEQDVKVVIVHVD